MRMFIALIAGAVFGVGLVVSDMIDPARVLAFLDVAGGAWDPTLAFVMGGAMAPMIVAWIVSARRAEGMFGGDMPSSPNPTIDVKLLSGAGMFGLGWGLVGLCPGPALSGLLLGGWPVLIFVAAMAVGMGGYKIVFDKGTTSAMPGAVTS